MARRRKKQPVDDVSAPAKLQAFHDRIDNSFSFSRFYWESPGSHRESMVPNFAAKHRPPNGCERSTSAAATQVLLPRDAPQDYFNVGFLARHYEDCLPPEETIAYAQVTIRFPDARNLHVPFEIVRAWAIEDYCADGLPVVAFLHDPALVGCEKSPGHVHLVVFPRRINHLGWAGMVRDIANDASRAAAWQSWSEYLRARDGWLG